MWLQRISTTSVNFKTQIKSETKARNATILLHYPQCHSSASPGCSTARPGPRSLQWPRRDIIGVKPNTCWIGSSSLSFSFLVLVSASFAETLPPLSSCGSHSQWKVPLVSSLSPQPGRHQEVFPGRQFLFPAHRMWLKAASESTQTGSGWLKTRP